MSSIRAISVLVLRLACLRLRVPIQPRGKNLLLVTGVLESVAAVEHTEVVHVLDITLVDIKTHVESLGEEMNGVECFGLGFGDGREGRRSREPLVSCEGPSDILHGDSFFVLVACGQVMQQWDFVVGAVGVAETAHAVSHAVGGQGLEAIGGTETYFSGYQSPARVAIRSGLVSASSLYTLQLLDSLD